VAKRTRGVFLRVGREEKFRRSGTNGGTWATGELKGSYNGAGRLTVANLGEVFKGGGD